MRGVGNDNTGEPWGYGHGVNTAVGGDQLADTFELPQRRDHHHASLDVLHAGLGPLAPLCIADVVGAQHFGVRRKRQLAQLQRDILAVCEVPQQREYFFGHLEPFRVLQRV